MHNDANPTATPTDADLLAALDKGIEAGEFIVVTDELLAEWAAEAEADETAAAEQEALLADEIAGAVIEAADAAPVVDTYTDALGRTQHRVAGPRGVFLVTRHGRFDQFEVWAPNSLRSVYRSRDLDRALAHATRRLAA